MAPGNSTTNATVAHRIAAAFRRHGVTVTFGQSIPTPFHLAAPGFGIRQAMYRTENAGGAMADGYARISGRIGIVTAQNGPAATLLVPPLAEALKASVPVVALVQEVQQGTADRNAFQEIDHAALFAPVAKWVRRLDRAERTDDYVDMAVAAATSGRPGPVVLLVPFDVFGQAAGPASGRRAEMGSYPLDRVLADPAAIDKVADMLASAKRPLLVAGGGVHLSGATRNLAALQEAHGLPVGTTVMGKGAVDETHPLSLGVIGYFMGPGSRAESLRSFVRGADLVFFIGARTNQNGTDSWTLFPEGASYVHLDIDSSEVGRNYEATRLAGDARLTLDALHTALSKRDPSNRRAMRSAQETRIAEARGVWRTAVTAHRCDDRSPLRPERLMADIDTLLVPESIVVADASYASIWMANNLTARAPGQRFLSPRGMAGLGWGLPLAIGAQFAAPDRPVICITGDGGFGHVWSEIETLVRHRLPVVVIVLNNQILGYQKHGELVTFRAHTDAVDFTPVDHAAIAQACGCTGVRVTDARQFLPTLKELLASRLPALIDAIVDPNAYPPITSFGAGPPHES